MRIIFFLLLICNVLNAKVVINEFSANKGSWTFDGEWIESDWIELYNSSSSSQLSNIDFNNDGINDVFVFERIGDRTLALIKNSNGSDLNYTYSKEYSSSFPKLEKWALLLDFNCDGKEDIFTYNDSYVRVYKNTSDDNSLSFEVETNALISDLGPIQSAIIISEVDIPSFVDVDFDGDIDVLTFKQSGGYV